jgi:hypothetical protein
MLGGMGSNSALVASGTETLFGTSMTVVSALLVSNPNGFVAHNHDYAGKPSDCYVDLKVHRVLNNQFDNVANGNVVQCGELEASVRIRNRQGADRTLHSDSGRRNRA